MGRNIDIILKHHKISYRRLKQVTGVTFTTDYRPTEQMQRHLTIDQLYSLTEITTETKIIPGTETKYKRKSAHRKRKINVT